METTTIDIHHELIEHCKSGDHAAFGKLYQYYAKAMFNVAFRIIKEEDEAQDILQEAFIKAYKKIAQFDYQASFGAWLKRIVINQALDTIRKRKGIRATDVQGLEMAPPEEIDWNEVDFTVNRIRKAIMMLPDGFRIVCSMYLFDGFEHKEIAEILGISENTSKSQLHRGKLKIKEILSTYEKRSGQTGKVY